MPLLQRPKLPRTDEPSLLRQVSPFWLYFLLAALAFSPCLFFGQAYSANDLLDYFSHSRSFLRDQLFQGHFPLWAPHLYGGQPFFANPNAMMGYPLNYPTLLFPIPYGVTVFFFIHMILSGLGMRFWLRGLGLGERACGVGAFLFALSGFFWFHLPQPNLLAIYAWSPWFLGCLERSLRTRSNSWAFLTGLSFAVIFCAGNFQLTTCVLYMGLAYFLFFLFARLGKEQGLPAGPRAFSFKKWAVWALFALWGGFPLLVQWVPAHEFYVNSFRSNSGLNYDNFSGTFSMVPKATAQFLFPYLGVPPGTTLEKALQVFDHPNDKDNDFSGVFGYLGIWAPFLMVFAFRQKDKKRVYFLAGLGLLSLFTAWGHYFPLHRWECLLLPGIGLSRAPYRFIQTYVLFAAALSAFGYQNLEKTLVGKKISRVFVAGSVLYLFILLAVAFLRPEQTWREMAALLLGGVGLALWAFGKDSKRVGHWAFTAAALFPLLLNGWAGFSRGPASNYDFEKNFQAFHYLKESGKGKRYFFDNSLTFPVEEPDGTRYRLLPQDSPMTLGIRSMGGHDGIFLQKSFDLTRLPPALYIRLMAMGGQVLGRPIGEMKGVLHHSFPGAEVYEPLIPEPYVNSPNQVQRVTDDSEALQVLSRPGFDPATQLVLSGPGPSGAGGTAKADVRVAREKDTPDDQVFHLLLSGDSWVLFSEIMYPGWKARIDGKDAPLFTGDYTFRALFVPAGEHRVEFRFEPAWAGPLLGGLLLWLVSLLVYGHFKGWTSPQKPPKMGHA